jgi:hypothetical protein
MSLQARIQAEVDKRIDAAINAAIDKALGGGPSNPAASLPRETPSASVAPKSNGNGIQELVDVARRAIRYGRENKSFSKAERKVASKVIKNVKAGANIVNTGSNDVWRANGC